MHSRRSRTAPIYAIALTVLLGGPARGEDRLAREIAALAEPKIARGDSVGMVVGVVVDGRSEVFGFGKPAVDAPAAPDGRTVFEIGSITKVFTSLALADMAREGLVRLDDPVASLLPAGVQVPERDGRAITLRTLANHTSGLPRVMPLSLIKMLVTGDPYAGIKEDDVYRFLKIAKLQSTPGATFSYSNVGGGLLGLALARRAGTTYEGLIAARVCRPLGMADTVVTPDPGQATRQARPYLKGRTPSVYWHSDALAGAGALRSTADDLLRFARVNLDPSAAPARLRAAMLDVRTPTADLGDGRPRRRGWEGRPRLARHPRPGRAPTVRDPLPQRRDRRLPQLPRGGARRQGRGGRPE